jgi:uncharacterized membrane protein
LQLRLWTAGALDAPRHGLFDQAVQTLWWLGAASALLRPTARARLATAWHGGAALLALACAQIVFGHMIAANPLFTGEAVGGAPVFNLLGLAYLAPAALLAALAADKGATIPRWPRMGLWAGAMLLGFAFVTLEVRRAFQGPVLALFERPAGQGELYAYSAAWIVAALGLLAAGILRRASLWRQAGLAVLALTSLKVFLYDMSDLGGLLRVASFLGLGLTLIGIGWLYRRFTPTGRPG